MSTHVVTKRLPVGREVLEPGAEVDASEWRNVTKLEEQRYLKPIRPDERTRRVGRKDKNESGD